MSGIRQSRRLAAALSLLLLCMPGALCAESFHIGAEVPAFKLQNLHGSMQTVHPGGGKITAILFFSTRCPLSNAFNYRRNVLYHDFHGQVRFLLVDPNANESLAEVKAYARQSGFDIPVYRDPDGEVAALLDVRATTDTFVLDKVGAVRYRGNVENAPNPERATQHGLRAALEEVVAGQPVLNPETRPMGCAVRRLHPSAVQTASSR